mmetsp:Transcript_16553/g.32650  ORF Transcript_16553/g.32650 Transcript_16553/m.32650 type:complete len:617 (-) Transcript_16553:435-2285(-)
MTLSCNKIFNKMLMPLALVALLAAPGSAFMPAVTPVLRRSPILSSRTKAAPFPNFGGHTGRRQPRAASIFFMSADQFTVGVLGDLHIDPRKMEDYETGKQQWLPTLETAKSSHGNVAMVSLGDLGESKSVRPAETSELFAGTTECHKMAAEYLGSFGVPYEVIGGNHDLEGLDEFDTDEANLEMFLREHNKPSAQFKRQIAEKTLLVGLGSTVFRSAKYTSHEVTIDDAQMVWFEEVLKEHPSTDGWKIFVFTHAPPNGSGLRVLQENHVVNGCCWLNHSDEKKCSKFIELVREHRCIKAWFSGHFHLGQDYQDSITFPTIDPKDGPYPNRGSCVFVQTSVMRGGTSRDGRQQSRLIRGDKKGFEICTVDHQKDGAVRVDATITYTDLNHEIGVYGHKDVAREGDEFFKVYQPCQGDELHPPDKGYIPYGKDGMLHVDEEVTKETVAWWRMACGRTMGMLNGMLVEYDSSTLAPLGLIVGADELVGKRITVLDSGLENCLIDDDDEVGMEGADCGGVSAGEMREQAVVMYDPKTGDTTVVQPNEDGSYWRKIVRNKMVRMKEVRRIKAAREFARELLNLQEGDQDPNVVSSWGPYTTTSGTAKRTGVAGLTVPAAR